MFTGTGGVALMISPEIYQFAFFRKSVYFKAVVLGINTLKYGLPTI